MMPSNYPPGVTGNEPEIAGESDLEACLAAADTLAHAAEMTACCSRDRTCPCRGETKQAAKQYREARDALEPPDPYGQAE